jgi:hypothetical protein
VIQLTEIAARGARYRPVRAAARGPAQEAREPESQKGGRSPARREESVLP